MPGVMLTILPGVELEFFPSVGILVLGILNAEGHWEAPIRMRPAPQSSALIISRLARQLPVITTSSNNNNNYNARLCLNGECPACLLYTSPSPRDRQKSRMPSSA